MGELKTSALVLSEVVTIQTNGTSMTSTACDEDQVEPERVQAPPGQGRGPAAWADLDVLTGSAPSAAVDGSRRR